MQFTYNGHVFHPLRNLTIVESGFENIDKRTYGFANRVEIDGYDYKKFYSAAQENGAVVDLFLMDETEIVLPHSNGLLKYNNKIKLQQSNLTYYSNCCGKVVNSYESEAKNGYCVKGTIKQTGDTYCSRCKRDVTKTGKVKDTPRNKDIDQNGSWGYESAYKEE